MSLFLHHCFRQQLQHSANCLAKETNEYLKELGSLPLPLSASEQVCMYNFLEFFDLISWLRVQFHRALTGTAEETAAFCNEGSC